MGAMDKQLRELFEHQAWADAKHWTAILAHPRATDDGALRRRLYHIHLVQRAFLSVWQGQTLEPPKPESFPTLEALKDWGRDYHEQVLGFLDEDELDDERLDSEVLLPWFQDPPCRTALRRTLHQALMHSHYHRGQNATRLRDLGAKPPTTDLIVWYWKGCPPAEWP